MIWSESETGNNLQKYGGLNWPSTLPLSPPLCFFPWFERWQNESPPTWHLTPADQNATWRAWYKRVPNLGSYLNLKLPFLQRTISAWAQRAVKKTAQTEKWSSIYPAQDSVISITRFADSFRPTRNTFPSADRASLVSSSKCTKPLTYNKASTSS